MVAEHLDLVTPAAVRLQQGRVLEAGAGEGRLDDGLGQRRLVACAVNPGRAVDQQIKPCPDELVELLRRDGLDPARAVGSVRDRAGERARQGVGADVVRVGSDPDQIAMRRGGVLPSRLQPLFVPKSSMNGAVAAGGQTFSVNVRCAVWIPSSHATVKV